MEIAQALLVSTPHASLIEEVTERVRLAPTEDEDLATLSIVHRLILPLD